MSRGTENVTSDSALTVPEAKSSKENLDIRSQTMENLTSDNILATKDMINNKDDSLEIRHLKELTLVHLDLIQQQQELLVSKDRQIQTLRRERDAVCCFYYIYYVFKCVAFIIFLVVMQNLK